MEKLYPAGDGSEVTLWQIADMLAICLFLDAGHPMHNMPGFLTSNLNNMGHLFCFDHFFNSAQLDFDSPSTESPQKVCKSC